MPESIEIIPFDASDGFDALWEENSGEYSSQDGNTSQENGAEDGRSNSSSSGYESSQENGSYANNHPSGEVSDESDVSKVSVSYSSLIQSGGGYYWCSLHPRVRNIHKESIEHHCQYSEPDKHLQALRKLGENV
ncbi:MAG: hypothetical protein HRF40_06840 [Nitrososphaera sp.]|jgi:hypothetical protein